MDIVEDINDATNITGMSKLLNAKNTDSGLNAELIERDMIARAGIKLTKNVDPEREFRETMREIGAISGVPISDMNLDASYEGSGTYTGASGSFTEASGSYDYTGSSSDDYCSYEDSDEGSYSSDEEGNEDFIDKMGRDNKYDGPGDIDLKPPKLNRDRHKHHRGGRPNVFGKSFTNNWNSYNQYPPEYQNHNQYQTDGQNFRAQKSYNPYRYEASYPGIRPPQRDPQMVDPRQNQFDQVLQSYGGTPDMINAERENQEETKTYMLEDIDQLWAELEDDDVDLTRIPSVNQDSPLADVEQVQKILRMKYDRRRYTTLGTEVILAGVHGLEYLFDGKRKWGPYQPDLTNWHNTVRTKMRRMRYETSMIVSDVMHQWNVGPLTRVMIELVPSAFLHSRMRSDQHGKAGYTPDQMSDAYNALRQYDNE